MPNHIQQIMIRIEDANKPIPVQMPQGSKLLGFDNLLETCVLYIEADPKQAAFERSFYAAASGEVLPPAPDGYRLEFVNTVQFRAGTVVLHFYEIAPRLM